MNCPPPREIPKLRDQLARYTETQRAASVERKRRVAARMRAIEERQRMEAVRRQRAREERTTVGQHAENWIVIYQRPPIVFVCPDK